MKDNNNNNVQNNATKLHMTAEVWNALADLMDMNQLENFLDTIGYVEDKMVSDSVVTNCVDDFGGPARVLLMLNAFKRMEKLFAALSDALRQRGDALQGDDVCGIGA